ncbi:phytase [Pholiota molesta]|nr:phytase [Pholiota molesta]
MLEHSHGEKPDEDLGFESSPLLSPPFTQPQDSSRFARFWMPNITGRHPASKAPWGTAKRVEHGSGGTSVYDVKKSGKKAVCLAGIAFLCLAVVLLFFSGVGFYRSSSHAKFLSESRAIRHSWGAYAPYYAVEPYTPPPDNCRITQIQRHGARFPTFGASLRIIAAVEKLQGATNYTTSELSFLSNYTYTLATNADLLPFGAFQSRESGREAYERYSNLISHGNLPFVRASSGVRVVDSATNWTLGFSIASNRVYTPKLSVILSESLNDTLDDKMCPNVGSSDAETAIWANIYATPIAARLNAQAIGANLTPLDVTSLMALCAFESIANHARSPFCALFTPEEYTQYEYFVDLGKYYKTGPGAPLGRVQGVGYVNELLARLTGTPVADRTQTNRTLDAARKTFPLHRALYADFSHDNQIVAVFAALGLFKQRAGLDPARPDGARTWVVSRLTPFSGRMGDVYVRILVNDALQPLEFCGGDQDGLCTLRDFVESQVYARENGQGDFEKCFE